MANELKPGMMFGHYEIVRLLGRGGMGEVWEANDQKLGRKVALKILPAELVDKEDRRSRFEREARAIAALQHPNIVTVHSIEEHEGQPFLVMELVEGKPLSEIIPAGGMDLEKFLDAGVQISEALAAAHARNITHRDLKPANILVDQEGRVRILDFGLAKWVEEVAWEGETLHATRAKEESLTGEGQIVGTVAYMSPEQAEGKGVDHRSDIFSLGVVLYQMASGRRPFEGESGMSLISSILRDDPDSISDVRPAYPRHAGRIVRRCLQKDPSRRYQTVLDLRNDLLELREDLDSGVLELGEGRAFERGSRRNWIPWAVIALLVMAAAVAALMLGGKSEAESSERNIRRLLTQGAPWEAAISPDGRYVAYESTAGEFETLRLLQIGTGSDIELVSNDRWDRSFENLHFSSNGDYLYYNSHRATEAMTLWQIPILGGQPRKILDRIVRGGLVSPDGRWIAAVRGDDTSDHWRKLEIVAFDDGSIRASHTLDEGQFVDLTWSHDGSQLFLTVPPDGADAEPIYSFPADGGDLTLILDSDAFDTIFNLCASPGGEFLLVNAPEDFESAIWSVDIETGRKERLHSGYSEFWGCSTSADEGALVTIRNDVRSQLWVAPVDDPARLRQVRTTSGSRDGFDGVNWISNDELVYAAPDEHGPQVWKVAAAGGTSEKLTRNGGVGPTGTTGAIIYGGEWRGAGWGIWVLEGDQRPRRLSKENTPSDSPAFRSPDGKWVIHQELVDDGMRLIRRPWEGGEAIPIYDGAAHLAHFSPDGTRFNSHVRGTDGIYRTAIFPADFSDPLRMIDIHSERQSPWASDDSIYHVRTEEGIQNIYEVSIEALDERRITDFSSGEEIFSFDVSPDLTRLAIARGQLANELLLIENPMGR